MDQRCWMMAWQCSWAPVESWREPITLFQTYEMDWDERNTNYHPKSSIYINIIYIYWQFCHINHSFLIPMPGGFQLRCRWGEFTSWGPWKLPAQMKSSPSDRRNETRCWVDLTDVMYIHSRFLHYIIILLLYIYTYYVYIISWLYIKEQTRAHTYIYIYIYLHIYINIYIYLHV